MAPKVPETVQTAWHFIDKKALILVTLAVLGMAFSEEIDEAVGWNNLLFGTVAVSLGLVGVVGVLSFLSEVGEFFKNSTKSRWAWAKEQTAKSRSSKAS